MNRLERDLAAAALMVDFSGAISKPAFAGGECKVTHEHNKVICLDGLEVDNEDSVHRPSISGYGSPSENYVIVGSRNIKQSNNVTISNNVSATAMTGESRPDDR